MGGISCLSLYKGRFTICFEVNIIRVVMQHMPDSYEHLSCHGDQDLHLVLSPDLCLAE